jgi:TonB family protein
MALSAVNFVFQDGGKAAGPRSSALGASLLVHAVVIFLAVNLQQGAIPPRNPSEYRQIFEGKDSKIVWYRFPKDLPSVTPARKRLDDRPLRAESKAAQPVVSSPKNAPKRTQMVWTPAPELAPPPIVESPNILALKLPEMPRPAPKQFVAPPAPPPTNTAKAQLAADAPLLDAHRAQAPDMPQLRLPPKAYIAPPPPVRISVARVIAPVDAPLLPAGIEPNPGAPPIASPKLPPRPFTAPPSGSGSVPSKSAAIDSPPPPDIQAGARDINVAVVGLNPLDKPAPLPTMPSRAEFSAGPQPRASGAVAEGAGGLSVPDLFVRGARTTRPDLIAEAYASPTSSESVRAAMRRSDPVTTVHVDPSVPSRGDPAREPAVFDGRFTGREVFMMAIQMPNLTSYSGSWLMWYSIRTAREADLAPLSAPVPHRKVDPKYVATAVEERVEGRVQLACVIDSAGKVSAIELVRGLDDRLNQSAREALAKWEFYPARRSGVPVDVDVLVEIPFRLAPRLTGR